MTPAESRKTNYLEIGRVGPWCQDFDADAISDSQIQLPLENLGGRAILPFLRHRTCGFAGAGDPGLPLSHAKGLAPTVPFPTMD